MSIAIPQSELLKMQQVAKQKAGIEGNKLIAYADQNTDFGEVFKTAWDDKKFTRELIPSVFYDDFADDWYADTLTDGISTAVSNYQDALNAYVEDEGLRDEIDTTEILDAVDEFNETLKNDVDLDLSNVVSAMLNDIQNWLDTVNDVFPNVETGEQVAKVVEFPEASLIDKVLKPESFKGYLLNEINVGSSGDLEENLHFIQVLTPNVYQDLVENNMLSDVNNVGKMADNVINAVTSEELFNAYEDLTTSLLALKIADGRIVVSY